MKLLVSIALTMIFMESVLADIKRFQPPIANFPLILSSVSHADLNEPF
jgi:hypothetical protein